MIPCEPPEEIHCKRMSPKERNGVYHSRLHLVSKIVSISADLSTVVLFPLVAASFRHHLWFLK